MKPQNAKTQPSSIPDDPIAAFTRPERLPKPGSDNAEETLIVPPPTFRERLLALQRARENRANIAAPPPPTTDNDKPM